MFVFLDSELWSVKWAARNVCAVYGEGAIAEGTAKGWLSRSNEKHFDLSDVSDTGRSPNLYEDHFNAIIHDDPCQTTRELVNELQTFNHRSTSEIRGQRFKN